MHPTRAALAPSPVTMLVTLALVVAGCLPDAPELDDGGDALPPCDLPPLDTPLPFALVDVQVEDPSGRAWEPSAAPRRPTVVLRANRPWSTDAPAWLLTDALDAATLMEDLDQAPARLATLETRLDVRRETRGATLRLTPVEPLPLNAGFR